MLLDESGISADVAAERGYGTVTRRRDLESFKAYQRRVPALLLPVYSPDGVTTTAQLRPDNPRQDKKGKAIKYDTPGASRALLDVHPRMQPKIGDVGEPLWVTEGIKKGDALTSRSRCTVALIGVWNWQRDGELLSCWDHVALDGRRVYVVFDADIVVKENVQLALERFVEALTGRGAEVRVVYLPGPEKGVDDYLAAGGTVEDLEELAQPFERTDLGRIRLSRDDQLRALVEDLERAFWAHEWKGMGGHSTRDVFKELIEVAAKCGKPHTGGVRVRVSWRTLAERAKVSSRTLGKAIERLEEWGLARRDNEGRKPDRCGAFVLRANVKQVEGRPPAPTTLSEGGDPGALHLRGPRLMWSSPKRKVRRGVVHGTRRVRSAPRQHRSGRKRLGKICGAFLDALDAAGSSATVVEICEALHRSRPRDLKRRVLPVLEEAGIIVVRDGDLVSLADDWLEALDWAREAGGEIESERLHKARHRRQREAFRRRLELVPDRAPTEEEMLERREARPLERREAIRVAVSRLFAERPEYRSRRVGQVTCALVRYLPEDFPRGVGGFPKDAEVEELLEGAAA